MFCNFSARDSDTPFTSETTSESAEGEANAHSHATSAADFTAAAQTRENGKILRELPKVKLSFTQWVPALSLFDSSSP